MCGNNLKTAFNTLYRDRLYTCLNLAGLALSFACFLVIFLYLRSELSYNRHIPDHGRIYRLTSTLQVGGSMTQHAKVGRMVGPLLARDYAQFADYTRLLPFDGSARIMRGENGRTWPGETLFNADNSVFDFFSLDVIAGDPASALTEPRRIAISERAARFYFGDEDPVGQALGIQLPGNTYTVDLVFADMPANTSYRFDMLFSNLNSLVDTEAEDFFRLGIADFNTFTFFRLPGTYDPADTGAISEAFFSRYVSAGAAQAFAGQNPRMDFALQPFDEIYLSAPLEDDVPKGNPLILVALSAVAIFILGIASINYMNLSTARFAKRAMETGVRRTLGASGVQLAWRFIAESLLLSLLALLIGISAVEILFSTAVDSTLLGRELSLFDGNSVALVIQLFLVACLVGLVSGSYPAFYFSTVKPVDVFRPVMNISGAGISLRGLLIGLQLLVSISVIAGALVMHQQVAFLQNRPLGFDKENKLVIRPVIARVSDYRILMTELRRQPGIYDVTMTDQVPGTQTYDQSVSMLDDGGEMVNLLVDTYVVDEHYLDTFSISLADGRNFTAVGGSSEDLTRYPWLVNETLVRRMGWDDPVGREIRIPSEGIIGEVVGVVRDFNFSSLREAIHPLVMDYFYDDWRWGRYLVVNFDPDKLQAVLDAVRGQLAAIAPDSPFEYFLLDETLDALYGDEQRQAQLTLAGALVCIAVAILGLFGLTAFTIDQRTKEIGIRRVLGASVTRILAVMFRSIILLTIVAALVASTLVFIVMTGWLQGFAYRIAIGPVIFIEATGLVMGVIGLTLAFQSIRVSRQRPVESLRYE